MKNITIHFMIFFTTLTVFSQNNEIGIFAGGANYIGDVGPSTYIHPFSYNVSANTVAGIIFRKNLNDRIALRGKFNYAKIGSSDNWPNTSEYRKQRRRYFKNNILEIGLGTDFNFVEFDIYDSSFQMTPYLSTGISLFSYNLLRYLKIITLDGDYYNTIKYGKAYNFSIPITLGYKIKPKQNLIIGFEITANLTFSDNLDGSNPSKKAIASGYIGPNNETFGSNLSKDWYVFTGITLTYLFGNKKCYCPN